MVAREVVEAIRLNTTWSYFGPTLGGTSSHSYESHGHPPGQFSLKMLKNAIKTKLTVAWMFGYFKPKVSQLLITAEIAGLKLYFEIL